ncbi:NAD(P)-dependent dehydrogenase (short-subunit alcohol dehydrogenase family) [Paraburkholderia sp. EB58]|jgi:NAD(P)-dependent dehydrogenase (short-subunit alcohol dehydrogenase family)
MLEMPNSVAGKRILVTGASSGLGLHFATVLAAHGAEVFAAARRLDALEALARVVGESCGRVNCVQLDVNDPASRQSACEAVGAIDVLVNNAGVVSEGSALEQSEEDWDRVVDTNLKSMFFMAQTFAKRMKETGGAIVNVASILGLRQAGGVLPYAVSKAGVIQLTKSLALEWARYDIRVNALAPGYIETELNQGFWQTPAGVALTRRIPQRRLGKLSDLDGPMLLLTSDASRYMTGSMLAVDGGHLVSSL